MTKQGFFLLLLLSFFFVVVVVVVVVVVASFRFLAATVGRLIARKGCVSCFFRRDVFFIIRVIRPVLFSTAKYLRRLGHDNRNRWREDFATLETNLKKF